MYMKVRGAEGSAVVMEADVLALAPVPVLAPEAEGQDAPERIFLGK